MFDDLSVALNAVKIMFFIGVIGLGMGLSLKYLTNILQNAGFKNFNLDICKMFECDESDRSEEKRNDE